MSCINIVLNIIPTLYEGYVVSVHRMVMENRPVDPGSIQGNHRPISFIKIKHGTRANDMLCKLSINNRMVGLVHKNHIIRTCLMYHAVCKVESQPFKRSYSQLTFFNFFLKLSIINTSHQKLPFGSGDDVDKLLLHTGIFLLLILKVVPGPTCNTCLLYTSPSPRD